MSSASSETNQSQTVTPKAFQGFSLEEQPDTQSDEFSNVLEPDATTSNVTPTEGNGSPPQTRETLSDLSPDSSCQASKDSQDEQVFASSRSHQQDFSDESPRTDLTHMFEDAEGFQTPNLAPASLLVEDEETSLTEFAQMLMKGGPEVPTGSPELMEITGRRSSCDGADGGPGSSAKSPRRFCEVAEPSHISEFQFEGGEPGDAEQLFSVPDRDAKAAEHLVHRHQEDSPAYTPETIEQVCSRHLGGVSEEASPLNTQDDGAHRGEVLSLEALQSEDVSSQSLSDATPETVTSARHFSFEDPVLGSTIAPPPPVPSEYFGSSVTGRAATVCPPRITADYAKVERTGRGSPGVDSSDPEGYFDCKQAASDLSEPDEPDPSDCRSSAGMPEKATERVPLSSESEEYEDAPFVHVGHADSGKGSRSTDPSDDEFTLCEASQPPAACSAGDGTDNYPARVRRATATP